MLLKIAEYEPTYFQDMEEIPVEVQKYLVERDLRNFSLIKNLDENLAITIVEQDYEAIQFIKYPSEKIWQNEEAIWYINEKLLI